MILVTGGAGFIGANFVRRWLSLFDEPLVNIDALKNVGSADLIRDLDGSSGYTFVEGDICDTSLLAKLFATHSPRAVIHFAAESHVDKSIDSPRPFVESNVIGTFELLQASSTHQKNTGAADFRFLHVSTDEVFGTLEPDEASFTENSNYRPNSAYSASKAASDHFVRAWFHTYKLPTLITHCSNNYGPYQYPEKLIPLVISKALNGDAIPIFGDGQQIRDWLYVTDHCDAIMSVLEKGVAGETYNIGGASELPNLAVVQSICETLDALRPLAANKSYKEQITYVADRPGHDRRYSIDFTKASSTLGWSPSVSFEKGLADTIAWYLDNEEWLTSKQESTQRQGLQS